MLTLLLIWTLVTIASTCALLLLLVADEWQVRTRAASKELRSSGGQPTGLATPQAA